MKITKYNSVTGELSSRDMTPEEEAEFLAEIARHRSRHSYDCALWTTQFGKCDCKNEIDLITWEGEGGRYEDLG